jgi:hypothetical protein
MKRLMIFTLFFSHCTTVGFHEEKEREAIHFGETKEIKVCTFYEDGISEPEIGEFFSYWNDELALYSLKAVSIDPQRLERPGFYGSDILNYLYSLPLAPTCDRILYLKGRTWGDIVFEFLTLGIFAGIGLKLEVQGAVETHTNTRGYIKAKYISTLQLLFTSPKSTLVHEGYHLLGCGHQLFMKSCYEQIKMLKEAGMQANLEQGFFPSLTHRGEVFLRRKEVNAALRVNER